MGLCESNMWKEGNFSDEVTEIGFFHLEHVWFFFDSPIYYLIFITGVGVLPAKILSESERHA